EHRRRRQASAVDEPPRERIVPGQIERRLAERVRHRALGRDEIGRAGRMPDVLVGGERALDVVGIEQALRRESERYQTELPNQVVDVLDAAVRTARAER